MTEPQPMKDAAGAEFMMPPQMPEGVMCPPLPVQSNVMLTEPDANGDIFVVLSFGETTGTVSGSIRMPWQVAARFGMSVAQQLAQIQQLAAAHARPRLLRPGVDFPPGPIPPLGPNGGHPRG
jgi:hypothetical protein